MVCFGPKKCGPNILISRYQIQINAQRTIKKEDSLLYKLRARAEGRQEIKIQQEEPQQEEEEGQLDEKQSSTKESKSSKCRRQLMQLRFENLFSNYLKVHELTEERLLNSISVGFDLALQAGPLCEEPMIGSCFIVEEVLHVQPAVNSEKKESQEQEPEEQFENQPVIEEDKYGPITGQLFSAMKDCCLNAFLGAHPRLVESVYKCTLQTDFQSYGKAFDVLGQRRAKVISEILNNSTSMFLVSVHLPLSCSFGFYNSLQVATSGKVTAQLEFDGWVVLETDPFYQSITEEEYEENGQQVLQKNVARDLIDQTRKRKGLYTEVKIEAEKQRNLSKKK